MAKTVWLNDLKKGARPISAKNGVILVIDTKVLKTIDSIGREALDSLVNDGFFTYGWFKTLETSKLFNLNPFYVTISIFAMAKMLFLTWKKCWTYATDYISVEIMFCCVTRLHVIEPKFSSEMVSMKDCYSRIYLKKLKLRQ